MDTRTFRSADPNAHLCWRGTNEAHDALTLPFRCEECGTVYDNRDDLDDATFPA